MYIIRTWPINERRGHVSLRGPGGSDRQPAMRVRYGMAHGRFQPFHRGHLEYVLAALARSEHLIVGITNPDPWQTRAEAADAQRHTPEANPFTFFERQRMIRAALHEAGGFIAPGLGLVMCRLYVKSEREAGEEEGGAGAAD